MIEYLVVTDVRAKKVVGMLNRDGTVMGKAKWLRTLVREGKSYRDWDAFAPQMDQWTNGYVLVVAKSADSSA